MPAMLARVLAAAAFAPILCAGFAPNKAHAQSPQESQAPAEFFHSTTIETPPAWERLPPALPGRGDSTENGLHDWVAENGADLGDNQLSFRADDEPRGNIFQRLFRGGDWYYSWGYNKESWAPTDIHLVQPSQGNDFTIHSVRSHDEPGWNTGIFNKALFVPQTSIRLGRFVDEARTVAVEFNLDHTKYTVNTGQIAHVTGTIAGVPTDANLRLDDSFFRYKLHNGANHVMIDVVKRLPLIGKTDDSLSIAAIAKVGAGVMLPHAENSIMGHDNDVGTKTFGNLIGIHQGWWRLNGWTTGVELGFRIVLAKPLYLELTDKIAYARLGDIPVYQGTASHNLMMNEVILSVGFAFGGERHRE